MSRFRLLVLALVALTVLEGVSVTYAQMTMTGDVGVDLETYGFDNRLKTSGREFGVDRLISNHYLDLRMDGPLFSPELFQLDTRALFQGTNYHVAGEMEETDLYFKPSIPTYHAALSVFPTRRYPLRFYRDRSQDHSIRYEAQNRSKSDLVAPELAIVRRYTSELESRGAQWKLGVAQDIGFGAEVKRTQSKIIRRFDFDEHLDIWVEFFTLRPDPTASEHRITVMNEVPDDTLLVFIDLFQVGTVFPEESISFMVESGRHDVEIVPKRFNAYRVGVDVQGEMRWRVVHNPPIGSSDVAQVTNAVIGNLDIGTSGPFKNETYYEYNDTGEAVQKRTTYQTNFSNSGSYAFSRTNGIDMLTTYSQNYTEIDTVSAQLNKSFLQQGTLRLGTAGGMRTRFSYSYNWIASQTGMDDFESRSQVFGVSQVMPVKALKSAVDWRNTATLTADNRDYINNQYVTDLIVTSRIRHFGFNWTPRQQVKYTFNKQENPNSVVPKTEAQETEIGSMIIGDYPRMGFLGAVKVKGEYIWRLKDREFEIDTKNRYLGEITITRKFGTGYRIMLSATQEKETYGLEVLDFPEGIGPENGRENTAREDQTKQGYKLDIQASPLEGVTLGGNVMLLTQNETSISRMGASLNGKIPLLGIPIRWYVLSEARELEGLPKQTSFTMETKLSYGIRQISITLSHRAVKENLINEEYGYQEVRGEISRQFSVF